MIGKVRCLGLIAGLVSASVALAQPAAVPAPAPKPFTPPPGGGAIFGAPEGQAFTPDAVFPNKVVPVQPPAVTVPAATDGGLLPPAPPPKIWSGSFDTGLNGASGNSNLFNFRIAYNLRRKTETNSLTSDFVYNYATQEGETNVDQALFNIRDEILFANSPWTIFSSGQIEYDTMRDYKFRIGGYAGAGYAVVDNADKTFKLRAGAGISREIGSDGTANEWVPEFVFGSDFRYKFNDRSSFLAILDYYPQVDFSQYRVRARAAYEYILDPSLGMVLRLGFQDRYDSNPGTAKNNDLTYFTALGLQF